ncbi:hypothetical protein GQ43DRAFT_443207 [Delitschia confertaspora ATCC 74209]|uniref:Polyketide cyclase/dehydrase n=1 Tax=Delitschia confertaspora ATCC 74209 TaxID=1513339 RepID=A0A9P4JFP4_9PLEO|nr:hypothetical protein GQ43DRAFT_443207 [Delitschia confertaspora ATCC 74209]
MLFKAIIQGTLFALPALSAYVDVKRDTPSNTTNTNSTNSSNLPLLPPCGPASGPCTCPSGSFYVASTTYAFYPASAKDITAITGKFFDISWFGISINQTTGTDKIPGATRAAYEPVPNGVAELLTQEKMTNYTTYRSGGFFFQYEGINLPLKYMKTDGTTGAVAGSWEFIDVKEVTWGWTSFVWNIHACLTDVWELAAFHEGAMKNVGELLKKKRQLRGEIKGPFSF